MNKIVKLNGMEREIVVDRGIEIFEMTSSKIKNVEKYLTNFYMGYRNEEITYCFGIDENNIYDNFELKYIFRNDLRIVELYTTFSNQYVSDDFMHLLNKLNKIRKEGI